MHHAVRITQHEVPMSEETQLGRIEISPTAIATLAAQAVLQSYGVVGMAPKHLGDELMTALGDAAHRGVQVRVDGEIFRLTCTSSSSEHAHSSVVEHRERRKIQRRTGAGSTNQHK
jgi:hypothetical protein